MWSFMYNLIFILWKSHVPFLRYSYFHILSSLKVVLFSWVLAHDIEYILWICLELYIIWSWNFANFEILLWRILDVFGRFWALGSEPRPSLALQFKINQNSIMMRLSLFTILKMCSETTKNSKNHPMKIKKLHFTAILLIS